MFKEEIKGKYLSVTFNGTTHLGEVWLSLYTSYLIGKYSNALFVLEFLTKSMTGDEIAINVLSTVL